MRPGNETDRKIMNSNKQAIAVAEKIFEPLPCSKEKAIPIIQSAIEEHDEAKNQAEMRRMSKLSVDVAKAAQPQRNFEDKQAVAMTRVCLWYLKEQRQSIIDTKGNDAVPAYLNRCIDKLSCFEPAAQPQRSEPPLGSEAEFRKHYGFKEPSSSEPQEWTPHWERVGKIDYYIPKATCDKHNAAIKEAYEKGKQDGIREHYVGK